MYVRSWTSSGVNLDFHPSSTAIPHLPVANGRCQSAANSRQVHLLTLSNKNPSAIDWPRCVQAKRQTVFSSVQECRNCRAKALSCQRSVEPLTDVMGEFGPHTGAKNTFKHKTPIIIPQSNVAIQANKDESLSLRAHVAQK